MPPSPASIRFHRTKTQILESLAAYVCELQNVNELNRSAFSSTIQKDSLTIILVPPIGNTSVSTRLASLPKRLTMHLILTAATRLIGSSALDAMIGMKEVTKFSILRRRPMEMAENIHNSRIDVIRHKDFAHYDSDVLAQLKGATGCV